MRVITPAQMIGRKQGRAVSHEAPRAGTKVRAVYDLFMAHRGHPVDFNRRAEGARIIDDLQDYYGLDIRRVGKRRYLLAGEWFGSQYIDYVAARINAEAA